MRFMCAMFVFVGSLPLLAVAPVEAQRIRTPYRNAARTTRPTLTGIRSHPRRRLGTVWNNRYGGVRTRPDRIREIMGLRGTRRGLVPPLRPSAIRMRLLMDRRNLLSSRSSLGRQVAASIGRLDFLPDESGTMRGVIRQELPAAAMAAISPLETTVPKPIVEQLASQLQDKADENFEMGISHFRMAQDPDPDGKLNREEKDNIRRKALIGAQNCFDIVRRIERDRPRAFVADLLVSVDRRSYNRAILSMERSLDRAQNLDELRIDRFIERFYAGPDLKSKRRAFERTLESVNLLAKSSPGAGQMDVLLAYYAWLGDDFGTAITAVETAEAVAGKPLAPEFTKFRQWLIEARDSGHVPGRDG